MKALCDGFVSIVSFCVVSTVHASRLSCGAVGEEVLFDSACDRWTYPAVVDMARDFGNYGIARMMGRDLSRREDGGGNRELAVELLKLRCFVSL